VPVVPVGAVDGVVLVDDVDGDVCCEVVGVGAGFCWVVVDVGVCVEPGSGVTAPDPDVVDGEVTVGV
jgi:hypothetical protein